MTSRRRWVTGIAVAAIVPVLVALVVGVQIGFGVAWVAFIALWIAAPNWAKAAVTWVGSSALISAVAGALIAVDSHSDLVGAAAGLLTFAVTARIAWLFARSLPASMRRVERPHDIR